LDIIKFFLFFSIELIETEGTMPIDNQARIELLKKAREAKALKAKLAKEQQAIKIETNTDLKEMLDDEVVEEVIEVKKKPKAKQNAKTLNLQLPNANNDVNEVEETIKIKAPKKKKVIKRIIEVEESDTKKKSSKKLNVFQRLKTKLGYQAKR